MDKHVNVFILPFIRKAQNTANQNRWCCTTYRKAIIKFWNKFATWNYIYPTDFVMHTRFSWKQSWKWIASLHFRYSSLETWNVFSDNFSTQAASLSDRKWQANANLFLVKCNFLSSSCICTSIRLLCWLVCRLLP